MPMNARLLRPISTTHPEAQVWRNAVIANGGTVSGSTLNAVSRFCRAIDAAGIRDRFYRLSVMAGTGLNAALVPLYRGQSRTGTQYGNATDTNNGPFVSGDYAETGASGGLTGNGSSKYLDTGVAANTAALSNSHLSVWARTTTLNSFSCLIGAQQTVGGDELALFQNQSGLSTTAFFSEGSNANDFVPGTINNPTGLILGTAISSGDRRLFVNGAQDGSTDTSTITRSAYPSRSLWVFARNVSSFNSGATTRLSGYSFGPSMTGAQVSSFYTAMLAFQAAVSRT
jgi:hypothetical protein